MYGLSTPSALDEIEVGAELQSTLSPDSRKGNDFAWNVFLKNKKKGRRGTSEKYRNRHKYKYKYDNKNVRRIEDILVVR